MDNKSNSLEEALKSAHQSAKKKQKRFWILSILWIVVIGLFSLFFMQLLSEINENQRKSENNEAKIDSLILRLTEMEMELSDSKSRLEEAYNYFLNQWNTEAQKKKIIEIADNKISRQYISEGEEQFYTSIIDTIEKQNNPQDIVLQGLSYQYKREYDSAIQYFSKAIDMDPHLSNAYFYRGYTYSLMDSNDKAIKDYSLTIEVDPSSALRVYQKRALAYENIEDYPSAIADCKAAIKLDSTLWLPYHLLGFAYYLSGSEYFDEAESAWKNASTKRFGLSGQAGSRENLGLIYLSEGNWKQALDNCAEVNKISNNSWNAMFEYIAALKLHKEKQANAALNKWNNLKSPQDSIDLINYLPENLHKYIK